MIRDPHIITHSADIDQVAILNHRSEVDIASGAPAEVMIAPWGTVHSDNGDFVVDADVAKDIVDRFENHKVKVPIDLNHGTSKGGDSRAVAWITKLHARPNDGIYGSVEWTKRGKTFVEEREYRYLSPGLIHKKGSNRPHGLHHVALTNKPAIAGMPALHSSVTVAHAVTPEIWQQARFWLNLPTTATEFEIMEEFEKLLKQLREMAGVAATADQATTLAALSSKLKAGEEIRIKLCSSAGLDAKAAKDEEILTFVSNIKDKPAAPDLTQYTPNSEVAKLTSRLVEAEQGLLKIHAADFVKGGQEKGRIATHNVEAWTARYIKDPEDAKKALDLVPDGIFPIPGQITRSGGVKTHSSGGDGERASIIKDAAREFDSNRSRILCDKQAYINEALREHSQKPLSEEEVRSHAA